MFHAAEPAAPVAELPSRKTRPIKGGNHAKDDHDGDWSGDHGRRYSIRGVLLDASNENPLGDILRRYGFVPIYPPSNLINVGSLYYVDAAVRQFTAICNADKADLDGAVVTSRSWEMQESLERNGRFKTGVHVDIGEAINGSLDKNYAVTLNTSLTDVVLEEIPLGANLSIFQKLMANPQCSKIATQYLRTAGYVCQGQKILQATAEFRLGRDAQSKLATETIKDAVKQAIASQGEQPRAPGGPLLARPAEVGARARHQLCAFQHRRADTAREARRGGTGAGYAKRYRTEVTSGPALPQTAIRAFRPSETWPLADRTPSCRAPR
jgi:hypothetical protein